MPIENTRLVAFDVNDGFSAGVWIQGHINCVHKIPYLSGRNGCRSEFGYSGTTAT